MSKIGWLLGLLLLISSCTACSTVNNYLRKPIDPASFVGDSGLLMRHGTDGVNAGQYSNITYCNKTYSITAAHVGVLIDLPPLVVNEDADLAIYDVLDQHAQTKPLKSHAVAFFKANIGEPTFNPSWYQFTSFVFGGTVIAERKNSTAISSQSYGGASGSPVYNARGYLVGVVKAIQVNENLGSLFTWSVPHRVIIDSILQLPCDLR